uniref:DUF1115 domain-containing protein n=1 Tax=Syphacia muris TaxID=451379 RepID=A0A0N5AQE0_9BILA
MKLSAVFQYSPLYPLSAWPTVFVRSNSLNSAEFNKQLRAYVEKLSLGEPQTVNIIQWIQENLISFTESSKNSSKGDILNLSATDAAVCYERLWIYSHHLFSSTKRRKIVTEAKLLHLRGFSVPGKPGIIVVEGISENCKTFWETIVKYGWKKIVIRWKETEIVLPSGDGKTINYSDLKKLLTDMDLGYGFEKLLNLS